MATAECPKIVGLGEVLWDLFPAGPQLGGAPANFAHHAQASGAQVGVITRVGDDSLGQEVLRQFKAMHLPIATVQIDSKNPTGTVGVTLSAAGIPEFAISENAAWDSLEATPQALDAVRQADVICFGSLAQRRPASRTAIQQLLAVAPVRSLRIFDINLRQMFYSREIIEQSLQHASVLKLNDSELSVLAGMFALRNGVRCQIERLADTFALKTVALTCGASGSLIFNEGLWSEQLPQPVRVVDTVGAGDAFTAALAIGLLRKLDLDELHALASEVAGYVCSQRGATPPLPEHLRDKLVFEGLQPPACATLRMEASP